MRIASGIMVQNRRLWSDVRLEIYSESASGSGMDLLQTYQVHHKCLKEKHVTCAEEVSICEGDVRSASKAFQ